MKLEGKILERACEMVYEHYTGGCWHDPLCFYYDHSVDPPQLYPCKKCGARLGIAPFSYNPPLATSLDAWAQHIWPAMSGEQTKIVDNFIYELVLHTAIKAMWQATPIHHLEAALRAAEVEKCNCDKGFIRDIPCPDKDCCNIMGCESEFINCTHGYGGKRCKGFHARACPHCTNGKRSLYSLLMEEVG